MRMAGLALIALVGACSAPGTLQVRPPSPAASISPAPSPTWSLGLGPTAISAVDFSCRLPVFDDSGTGSVGGFIGFPSGTVTPDPAAGMVSIARLGRELVGDSYLHYYDRAYSRWLPVSRNAVSPDGSHFAYRDRAIGGQADPQARATRYVVAGRTAVELTFGAARWAWPVQITVHASAGMSV